MLKVLVDGTGVERAARLGTGAVAFLIAEMFFKWKSFSLECTGFLVTWLVLDAAVTWALKLRARPAQEL